MENFCCGAYLWHHMFESDVPKTKQKHYYVIEDLMIYSSRKYM